MRRGTQVDVNSGKTKQFRVTTSNVEENFTQVTIVYGELSLMSFLKVNNDAKIKDVLPQARNEFLKSHPSAAKIVGDLEVEIYPSVMESASIGQCKKLNGGNDPLVLLYPQQRSPIADKMAEDAAAALLHSSSTSTTKSVKMGASALLEQETVSSPAPPKFPHEKRDDAFEMANWYDAMSQWMNEIRASNQELNRKFDSIKSELQQQRKAATEEADEMNRKIEQQSKSIENLTAMMENELEWNALVRLTQLVDYYFLQHLKLDPSAFIFGREISLGKLIMQASRDSAVRQDLERYLVSKGSVLNFADMEKIHQVIRNVRNNFIHGRQLPELARIQTAKKYLSDGEATDLIDKIVGVLFPN